MNKDSQKEVDLHCIVYVSSSISKLRQSALENLLITFRKNNLQRKITGMLLYKDGNFMQLIEGPRDRIFNLLSVIEKDKRHNGLIVLINEPISARRFEGWSMAFNDLDSTEIRSNPAYSEFLNTPLTAYESTEPSAPLKLLMTFKKNMSDNKFS